MYTCQICRYDIGWILTPYELGYNGQASIKTSSAWENHIRNKNKCWEEKPASSKPKTLAAISEWGKWKRS